MKLSTVIPVLNEVDSLPKLHSELSDVAREQGYELEIIYVDDGSTDGSWQVIERLATEDPRVHGILFRRNFGKAAALSAGFAAATGELVFTLDADLQDDPREMPRFLAEIQSGLEVVSGWKQVRHDPWHKVWPSRMFNWLVGALTGVRLHDHNCGFKCYRREALEEVRLYGEMHRFVPVLAAARGWRIGEIVVQHRPRKFGKSKYGFKRIFKGLLDMLTVYFLTGFGHRPQHLLGTVGLVSFLLGVIGVSALAVGWLVTRLDAIPANDLHVHERAIFFYSMAAALLGAQFLSVGLLAEFIAAHASRDVVPYSIKQRVGGQVVQSSFLPSHHASDRA
jgi:glycosyltransferase involved in cell wall biosynthesis